MIFSRMKNSRQEKEKEQKLEQLQRYQQVVQEIGNALMGFPIASSESVPMVETAGPIETCSYLNSLSEPPGSLYHYQEDERAKLFFIGDVSGRGLPAALIALYFKGMIEEASGRHNISTDNKWINKTLLEMNSRLEAKNIKGRFVAINVILVWKETGVVYLWSMGGSPIYLFRNKTKELKKYTISNSPALGVFPSEMLELQGASSSFGPKKLTLNSGDYLILIDDGIPDSSRPGPENTSEQDEEFGDELVEMVLTAALSCNQVKIPSSHHSFDWVLNPHADDVLPKNVILTLLAAEKLFRLRPLPGKSKDLPAMISKQMLDIMNAIIHEPALTTEENLQGTLPETEDAPSYSIPGYSEYPQEDDQFALVIRRVLQINTLAIAIQKNIFL